MKCVYSRLWSLGLIERVTSTAQCATTRVKTWLTRTGWEPGSWCTRSSPWRPWLLEMGSSSEACYISFLNKRNVFIITPTTVCYHYLDIKAIVIILNLHPCHWISLRRNKEQNKTNNAFSKSRSGLWLRGLSSRYELSQWEGGLLVSVTKLSIRKLL